MTAILKQSALPSNEINGDFAPKILCAKFGSNLSKCLVAIFVAHERVFVFVTFSKPITLPSLAIQKTMLKLVPAKYDNCSKGGFRMKV